MSLNALFKGLILVLVGSLVTFGSVLADGEKCTPRAGYFNVEPGRLLAGLYQVKLQPPDFQNPIAVQRHLVFTGIWGQTLGSELNRSTRERCYAIFTPYAFPDTRVFLTTAQSAKQFDQDKLACQRTLEDILQHSWASEASINEAISWVKLSMAPMKPSGRSLAAAIPDAANVLSAAYPQIYEASSLQHALVSVQWHTIDSSSNPEYRAWVQSQRSTERLVLEPISICPPEPSSQMSAPTGASLQRHSAILPSGEIKISRRNGGPVPEGPLRYGVIVDDAVSTGSFVSDRSMKKYCNQEYSFRSEDSASSTTATVRLRCLSTTVYDLDLWTFIFCDPDDCAYEPREKAAITSLASELEISILPTEGLGEKNFEADISSRSTELKSHRLSAACPEQKWPPQIRKALPYGKRLSHISDSRVSARPRLELDEALDEVVVEHAAVLEEIQGLRASKRRKHLPHEPVGRAHARSTTGSTISG